MNNVIKEAIEYLRDYYLDWQDYIERFSFPRMDYYFLLINISSFYKMIDLAFNKLEEYEKDNSELNLLYVLISMPKRISFGNSIYDNFKMIRNCLEYNEIVLEKYKEDQETN